jgi:hypothetical protein
MAVDLPGCQLVGSGAIVHDFQYRTSSDLAR